MIPSFPWIAPPPSTLVQSKERKGSNFNIWQHCAKEEDDVNEELHALLSQQSLLEQRLRGLSSTTPQMLHSASGDARKLGKVIDFTAKLAEGVAVKVRQLDLAKVRIRVK